MVDFVNAALNRKERHQGASPWESCDPGIAAAIRKLTRLWAPFSTRSRRYPLYRLFGEIVGPAWATYVAAFPKRHFMRAELVRLDLREGARVLGFDGVRDRIRSIAKTASDARPRKSPITLSDWTVRARRNRPTATVDNVLSDTLASLIDLAAGCARKRPRTTTTVDSVNALRGEEHCRFCGNEPEVKSYLSASPALREVTWPHDHGNLVPSLSGRYCIDHRPRNHDGRWNPEYKRALRAAKELDLESQRLARQSASTSMRASRSGNVVVDDFYLALIQRRLLFPSDQGELRDLAARLVRNKVSDIKKFMVVLKAAGYKQREIAARCGISAQAVSKALKSLPAEYRLDA